MSNTGVSCPLCHAPAKLINAHHPGWQRSTFFAIYGCQYCDLQFAWPLQSNAALYEHIYRQADRLPGYDFYAGLARALKRQRSPLDWLAGQGPGYWFVREALSDKLPNKDGRIVEIGSGLGYFTHALREAGYDATGLDLSTTAVADAAAQFGNHYVSGDVRDYAARHPGSARAVVMIEVLEHLPSPSDMLAAIHRLLAPGGFALITTPNKSVFLAEEYWKTDNPPVHLWWFSETAIRRLAQTSGFDVGLWNFTGYNRSHATLPPVKGSLANPSPMKPHFLDEDGNIIAAPLGAASLKQKLKRLRTHLLPGLTRRQQKRRRNSARRRWADEHGDAIGIVLTKPTA